MKISDLINKYDFHDSSVRNLTFSQEKKEVIIEIVFCNWRQLSYEEGEPEILMGRLVFTDVFAYNMDANSLIFDDDEILSFTLVPNANGKEEILEIYLLSIIFSEKKHETKSIRIGAKDVSLILIRDT